jgi:hypothetical protein
MRELKPQPRLADTASRREAEEVLEIRARRCLLEEEAKFARQKLVRESVEIGHRRLSLIQRFLLSGAVFISFVLALVGSLSLPALVVALAFGGVGIAARNVGGPRGRISAARRE